MAISTGNGLCGHSRRKANRAVHTTVGQCRANVAPASQMPARHSPGIWFWLGEHVWLSYDRHQTDEILCQISNIHVGRRRATSNLSW